MKKIGKIGALNTRVVRQNSVVSLSIVVDEKRFSETFSPDIYKYEVGDLVEIKDKKVGFLNKRETITLIAKSSEESGLFARLKNLFFLLVALYFCFLALGVIYYGITLEFSIYRLFVMLAAACILFWMGKTAYIRFLIFRYFIFG